MTHVITNLCLRDGGCVDVCPVECIVPGKPESKWPAYYIDPDTCIDCGACVAECPFEAIFPEDEVLSDFVAKVGQRLNMPAGTEGFNEVFDGTNHHGVAVHLENTRTLKDGEVVDLTPAIAQNAEYFKSGPGYSAQD